MKKCSRILLLLLLFGAAANLAAAYKETMKYVSSEKENKKLKDLVIIQEEKLEKNTQCKKINFMVLQKINPDICAWISIPGTKIDYPVLIGKNDEMYLNHDYRGEYSELGSLFSFSDAKRDFSDAHICIFAHNVRKPQMFGELKRYREMDYAKEHTELYLYTPGKTERYRLISSFQCGKRDAVFAHKMEKNSAEFGKLCNDIFLRNELECMNGWIEQDTIEKIVTLSTCSEYDRTQQRFTVHFKKIEGNDEN